MNKQDKDRHMLAFTHQQISQHFQSTDLGFEASALFLYIIPLCVSVCAIITILFVKRG